MKQVAEADGQGALAVSKLWSACMLTFSADTALPTRRKLCNLHFKPEGQGSVALAQWCISLWACCKALRRHLKARKLTCTPTRSKLFQLQQALHHFMVAEVLRPTYFVVVVDVEGLFAAFIKAGLPVRGQRHIRRGVRRWWRARICGPLVCSISSSSSICATGSGDRLRLGLAPHQVPNSPVPHRHTSQCLCMRSPTCNGTGGVAISSSSQWSKNCRNAALLGGIELPKGQGKVLTSRTQTCALCTARIQQFNSQKLTAPRV